MEHLATKEWQRLFENEEQEERTTPSTSSPKKDTEKPGASIFKAPRSRRSSSFKQDKVSSGKADKKPFSDDKRKINLASFSVKQIRTLFAVLKDAIRTKIDDHNSKAEFESVYLVHNIRKDTVEQYID